MSQSIRVHVNGKDREVSSGLSVTGLLESFDLDPRLVVVELNREILARESFPTVQVCEGDRVELVHFVGGG
jgi:sulfur carrier protein